MTAKQKKIKVVNTMVILHINDGKVEMMPYVRIIDHTVH
jgi:hypothetical protein